MSQYQLEIISQNEIIPGNKYLTIVTSESGSAHLEILKYLHQKRPYLHEVHSVDECDVILVFCYIVSRAGTNIDAALNKLNSCSELKPAIFVVLHHTIDPEKIVPDNSRFIKRRNTHTVNCLFHEDKGLFKCDMNNKALARIAQHFLCQEQSNQDLLINLWGRVNLWQLCSPVFIVPPLNYITHFLQERSYWLVGWVNYLWQLCSPIFSVPPLSYIKGAICFLKSKKRHDRHDEHKNV